MELFILIGGAYALYTVGMAIATELDYREANRKWNKLKAGTSNLALHNLIIFAKC